MNEGPASNRNGPFAFTHWEVFEPLRQHVSFIVLFTLSAALAALIITYLYDEKYEATVTIMLKPTEVTRFKQHNNEDLALGAPLPNDIEFKVITQSLSDLMQSEPLLRRVVTRLHLDMPPKRDYSAYSFYQRWWYEIEDWLDDTAGDIWSILKYGRIIPENYTDKEIQKLADKDTKISSEDSYVFVMKVRDKAQRRVTHIADAIAAEMIATQQANDRMQAELRTAQMRERLRAKYAEIQDAERKIEKLLGSAHSASIQEELVQEENLYSGLKSNWLTVEAEMSQLDAKIASADAKLRNAAAESEPGDQRLRGDDYRKMASDRLTDEILLDGDRRKAASLEAAMSKSQVRLREFPRLQVEYDLLDSNRKRAQTDYDQINEALQEEILREKNDTTALMTAAPATATDKPVTPIKIYHVGLAAALGALVALGIAFLFGYFEIRLFVSPRYVEYRPPRPQEEPLRVLAASAVD
jgi:uncharacterized protein involved in exopolysaccharide biosynthesis